MAIDDFPGTFAKVEEKGVKTRRNGYTFLSSVHNCSTY